MTARPTRYFVVHDYFDSDEHIGLVRLRFHDGGGFFPVERLYPDGWGVDPTGEDMKHTGLLGPQENSYKVTARQAAKIEAKLLAKWEPHKERMMRNIRAYEKEMLAIEAGDYPEAEEDAEADAKLRAEPD